MVNVMAKIQAQQRISDLLKQAKTDRDGLGQLYDLYYDPIYRFCKRRLFDAHVAEDVTSTVFLQVARKIGAFTGESADEFACWLYAIANNHVNSYIRKMLRRKALLKRADLACATGSEECCCDQKQNHVLLHQAISKLKPKHQTIVTLRFFEKFSFEQIGKIVNAKPATVRVSLHRILKKLKRHLAVVSGDLENV